MKNVQVVSCFIRYEGSAQTFSLRMYHLRRVLFAAALFCGAILLKMSRYTIIMDVVRPSGSHIMEFRNRAIQYKFLLLPNLSQCREPEAVLVAVVLSTVERFGTREVIRKTWASSKRSKAMKDKHVAVYFIIAAPKYDYDMKRLLAEQEQYNDLIVTDVEESYENLVLKVYSLMVFFQQYCFTASFLMKVDDDVVIHLDRMFSRWIVTDDDENSIFCIVWPQHQPIRDPRNKWYISEEKWSKKFYPDYCDGPIYVIGRHAVNKIIEHTKNFDPFPFEDVFYTGIVASSADVPRVNWSDGVLITDEYLWKGRIACENQYTPLTFVISSFTTALGAMEAFRRLHIYTCIYIRPGNYSMDGY
ncbi:hypothetical protein Y032_0307g2029 [Ancylostoma ceylanicum]|nr:hypothetical protein Y032_0307g2029 [Ancylostoma ceylanicum]